MVDGVKAPPPVRIGTLDLSNHWKLIELADIDRSEFNTGRKMMPVHRFQAIFEHHAHRPGHRPKKRSADGFPDGH